MDVDGNGNISRAEFMEMRNDPEVGKALESLQVKPKHFDMYADIMFVETDGGAPPVMDMDHTINMIMRLRPGSKVSALDFASFQQLLFKNASAMKHQLNRVDKLISQYVEYDPEDDLEVDRQLSAVDAATRDANVAGITLAQVLNFSSEDILEEIQNRVGNADGSAPGHPPANKGVMPESFETLCIAHPENDAEAWSKETVTC